MAPRSLALATVYTERQRYANILLRCISLICDSSALFRDDDEDDDNEEISTYVSCPTCMSDSFIKPEVLGESMCVDSALSLGRHILLARLQTAGFSFSYPSQATLLAATLLHTHLQAES